MTAQYGRQFGFAAILAAMFAISSAKDLQNEKPYEFKAAAVTNIAPLRWSFTTGARPNTMVFDGLLNAIYADLKRCIYVGGSVKSIGTATLGNFSTLDSDPQIP